MDYNKYRKRNVESCTFVFFRFMEYHCAISLLLALVLIYLLSIPNSGEDS